MPISDHLKPSLFRLALAALLLVLLLGACSAGGDESSSGGVDAAADGGAEGAGSDDAAAAAEGPAAEGADADSAVEVIPAQANAAPGRMIARDATLSLFVADVTKAAGQVRAAVGSTEGYVVSEDITPAVDEAEGGGYAMLVLSVPSASLDQAVSQVAALGTVTASNLTSQDVTEKYVDTTARIETLQASVDRVRDLLGEATGVKDIVALERELSTREADLDALGAVQQSLEADVSRSSLTVEMRTDEAAALAAQEDPSGFLAGLRNGWSAFGTASAAVLTGIGALLPFVITLALLLLPVLWWHRRQGARRSAKPPKADQLPA